MARDSLSKQVADQLTEAIIAREFEVGEMLPSETELAERFDVSRLTVREAVKLLRVGNLVEVRGGLGTRVNPIDVWTDLSLLVQAELANRADDGATVSQRLVEVRRIIECGGAELAAARRDDDDLAALTRIHDELEDATRAEDLARFVEADLAFHDRIMGASGNPFIGVIFDPLRQVLEERRRETSAIQTIREHAAAHHRRILEAIAAGDPARAARRMSEHMVQTAEDLDSYVLGKEQGAAGRSEPPAAGARA